MVRKIVFKVYEFIFKFIQSQEEREWFASELEKSKNFELDDTTKKSIAREMLKSQAFDNFLAIKFVSFKRYGCEGAESMMGFFHEFFKLCGKGWTIW